MLDTWARNKYFDRVLLICSLLVFLMAEAMLIVGFINLRKLNPSLGMGHLLESLFVTLTPMAAGISGYYAVKRLKLTLGIESAEIRMIWLSRQFLVAAVCGYSAIIMNLILLN